MVDVREGVRLALFEAAEPVLQPGDQPGWVGVAEVPSGELHAVPGAPSRLTVTWRPGRCWRSGEAAELTRPQLARAQAVQAGQLPLQQLLQVLSGVGAAGVEARWSTVMANLSPRVSWRRAMADRCRRSARSGPDVLSHAG